jgi:penicillin-binding protein 1C
VEEPGATLPEPGDLDIATAEVCAESRALPNPFTPETVTIPVIAGVTRLGRSTLHRRIFVDPDTGQRLEGPCLGEIQAEPRIVRTPPEELVAWELSRGIAVQTMPPLSPACRTVPASGGPAIVSPSAATPYVLRSDAPEEFQRIPLVARAQDTGAELFWFQDGRFVAQGTPGEPLFLAAERGEHRLVVQDEQGRRDALTYVVE